MKQILLSIAYCYVALLNGQGLIFNKDSCDKMEELPLSRSTAAYEIDYSRYTPLNYSQFGGTCVAHSFAKAKAILINKRLEETTGKYILNNAFSPYWIYYNLSPVNDYQCSRGLDIKAAADWCLNKGIAPMYHVEYQNYHPFTSVPLGSPYPNSYPYSYENDAIEAYKYRFNKIFNIRSLDVRAIKLGLTDGMVFVVGMSITQEFQKAYGVNNYRYQYNHTYSGAHAMVVVGYSDYVLGGAFKLANSYGPEWGENGFIWIDYSSFSSMLKIALACSDDEQTVFGSVPDGYSLSPPIKLSDSTIKFQSADISPTRMGSILSKKDIKNYKQSISKKQKSNADAEDRKRNK